MNYEILKEKQSKSTRQNLKKIYQGDIFKKSLL